MTTTQLAGLLPELEVIRADFPILGRTVAGGLPLVYLDSANTSQKPQVVIDAMVDHLERHNANVARATFALCRSRWSTIVSITTCGFCEVFALSR